MLRVRFKTKEEDYRPISWPIKHPYWCTGQGEDYFILVAYADDEDYVMLNWPEAYNLDSEEVTEYTFTDRFPKPEWLKIQQEES